MAASVSIWSNVLKLHYIAEGINMAKSIDDRAVSARRRHATTGHGHLRRHHRAQGSGTGRAQRAERDRAQRYLDTAEVILLKLDTDGRIALVNRYGCSILGWSADELLGRNWIETRLPARIREEVKTKFHNLLGGDLSIIENPVLTRSGEERLVEWRNTVLRDDDGHVIGTFSSGTDITERHRAVEALRTAEERTQFVLQNANVGVWDMDYTTGVLAMVRHHGGPVRPAARDLWWNL